MENGFTIQLTAKDFSSLKLLSRKSVAVVKNHVIANSVGQETFGWIQTFIYIDSCKYIYIQGDKLCGILYRIRFLE